MRKRVGVIWARVSEDKGQDLTGQVRELRALAERMGVEVPDDPAHVVLVEGESAFKGEPPQKREVMELVQRRKADVLFIWSLDRWARRRIDGAEQVFRVLPRYGVTVVSHEEPWLSTEGIPDVFRETLGNLMLWLAEEESSRKSRRVRLRYETNRNRAAGGGGKAKWGRGRIPAPEEVARVRELREAGESIRKIAAAVGLPKSTVGDLVKQAEGSA